MRQYNLDGSVTYLKTGLVKWFNDSKGYGFIHEIGQTQDIFAHYSHIVCEGFQTLKEGDEVTFELVEQCKGPQAVNIVKVDKTL